MNGDSSRLYIPALGPLYDSLRDYAYPLIRITAGLMLMPHGAQKLFAVWGGPGMGGVTGMLTRMNVPMPEVFAWVIALLEFFGGALIAVGFLTRPIAAMATIQMFFVIYLAHMARGYFSPGIEFPL